MNNRIKVTFLILVLVQGLHSIEEYVGRLWEVFPPARFLTGLVSENNETGFLIINIGLFIFGIGCWLLILRTNQLFVAGVIWFWIAIEAINGVGHLIWSLSEKGYTPGTATAPVLLILAIYLAQQRLHIASGEDLTA